jgi:hypothetical protein
VKTRNNRRDIAIGKCPQCGESYFDGRAFHAQPGSSSSRRMRSASQPTFRVETSLHADPLSKLVAIDLMGQGKTGITVAFGITHQLTEALLPPFGGFHVQPDSSSSRRMRSASRRPLE